MNFSSGQCSSGPTQSRPFPARAVKRAESAAHTTNQDASARLRLTGRDSKSRRLPAKAGSRTFLSPVSVRAEPISRDGVEVMSRIAAKDGEAQESNGVTQPNATIYEATGWPWWTLAAGDFNLTATDSDERRQEAAESTATKCAFRGQVCTGPIQSTAETSLPSIHFMSAWRNPVRMSTGQLAEDRSSIQSGEYASKTCRAQSFLTLRLPFRNRWRTVEP